VIEGTVDRAGSPFGWAGAMFYPGKTPMAPANLSAYRYVAFSARGEPGTYIVTMFSQSKGDMPAIKVITVSQEWQEYRFAIADFEGVNSADIKGLMFAANRPGPFAWRVDHVRFE
jgi:hypothetical protein